MGLVLKLIVLFAQFIKTMCPFLAFIYMLCWGFLLGNPELFAKWDAFLGFFPNFLNDTFNMKYDIDGQDVEMGYVLAAASSFVLMFFMNMLENFVEFRLLLHREQVIEQTKEQLKIQKIVSQMEEKKEEFVLLTSFYGLLEIEVFKNDIYNNEIDIKKIQNHYLNIIYTKLHEKYETKITDGKIYFYANKFELFKQSIKELSELFKILKEILNKKGVTFDFMLTYFSSGDNEQNKKAFSILRKINALKIKNKIVVSKDIRGFCYKKNIFKFLSLGNSLLLADNKEDKDMIIELYQVQNID